MDVQQYKKSLKEQGLTYADLAQKTGLSVGCIARIMAGIARYPRVDTIEAIEKALGINLYTLTPEERAAGASATRKESITSIEDEMLYVFREIGKKHGEGAQRALITVAEKML